MRWIQQRLAIVAVLLLAANASAAGTDGPGPATAEAISAIQPDAIAGRIDRYRKRTLKLHVVDADGHPLAGTTVEVTQRRHAFLFGANLFRLDLHTSDPSQAVYQQRYCALFNYATLPFYWNSYEPKQGQTKERYLTEMARWCQQHNITAKGHPLIYQLSYPKWAPTQADPTMALLHARVDDLIPRFDGLINIWDLVNEANTAANYQSTGVGAWAQRDGAPQMVATALQWARLADKHHDETFIYNDYITDQRNVHLLQSLADRHQLPDVIGLQSHMHGGNWPLPEVWETAERFAGFGLPIHFTETTVLSGEHRIAHASQPPAKDWLSTTAGEAEQADYLVQFYTILFSHPSVQAITYWDFTDRGAWLGAPAGLLHADMTPKPAYGALLKLIRHDWWTHEQLTTDSNGNCEFRGFCGDYSVNVSRSEQKMLEQSVTLPMPGLQQNQPIEMEIVIKR